MWKDKLREIRALKREERQILERLSELEARLVAPKSPGFSDMPRGGRGCDMADIVAARVELEDKYRLQLGRIDRKQAEAEDAMTGLEPIDRMIVRYYYFDGLRWEDVCEKIHYSWRQVHRRHRAALEALDANRD